MEKGRFIHALPKALTRISVTGARDGYIVRNGDEAPVHVRSGRDGLRCECGYAGCAHITSLEMCGFVEEALEKPQAA